MDIMSKNRSMKKLIWIDLEMTGLNPKEDTILEIATIITDEQLNIIAKGPHIIINHPNKVLENMNEWCIEHHGKTGLTQAVHESTISLQDAEKMTLDFIKQHCDFQAAPLCGNSVWQDKFFMIEHMPNLVKYFHYRLIDTTSIKQVVRIWKGDDKLFVKNNTHRALDDIIESIEELKFYRDTVFKISDQS